MQLHQISPTIRQKTKKRVGRGGKHGTFSGRGVKGQKARAGARIRPAWRDIIKQIPKRRGYRFRSALQKPAVINLGLINSHFKEGDIVSVQSLLQKHLIGRIKGRMPEVKILGEGEIKKQITFKGLGMSAGAKEKVKKAGGIVI